MRFLKIEKIGTDKLARIADDIGYELSLDEPPIWRSFTPSLYDCQFADDVELLKLYRYDWCRICGVFPWRRRVELLFFTIIDDELHWRSNKKEIEPPIPQEKMGWLAKQLDLTAVEV